MKNKEEVKQIVLQLAQAAFDKKGRDIEILDLEGNRVRGINADHVFNFFSGCRRVGTI